MSADQRLEAATAAIAEREHLVRVRDLLAKDVANEEVRVQQLAGQLRSEQADVHRLTHGVMGFINDILDDGQLEQEKREVMEAQIRLKEAQGSLEMLRAQMQGVIDRLTQLVPAQLQAELVAARAAKEESLMRSGTTLGAELQDIAIRIESIDIELIPLADAVGTGSAAFSAIAEILSLLDAVNAPLNVAAIPFDTAAKKAKALAGEAQAKIVLFHRALTDVATSSFGDRLDVDPSDTMFADDWIRDLFSKRTPQERLANARSSMVARIERINAVLGPLRARHDELATRRAKLVADRQKLVG